MIRVLPAAGDVPEPPTSGEGLTELVCRTDAVQLMAGRAIDTAKSESTDRRPVWSAVTRAFCRLFSAGRIGAQEGIAG